MGNSIQGTFSLKEVFIFTQQYNKGNRFDNAKRDKIYSSVKIRKIHYFEPDRAGAPIVKWQVTTTSRPSYSPYTYRQKEGVRKGSFRRRKVSHTYDIVFEADSLSLNTKNWKLRLGSGKTWKKPSQKLVKSIYKETRNKWSKERIARHKKKRGLYLDAGDWNSRVQGINADFLFRCSWVYGKNGHLYGRSYGLDSSTPPAKMNPKQIMFFPKHVIVFLELLMNNGILKDV